VFNRIQLAILQLIRMGNRGKALWMVGANQDRGTSMQHVSHQSGGGGTAGFVQGRHWFIEDKQTLAAVQKTGQQGSENTHFSSLPLRKRKHAVIQTVPKVHALGQSS
jgi:ribosomal protein L2